LKGEEGRYYFKKYYVYLSAEKKKKPGDFRERFECSKLRPEREEEGKNGHIYVRRHVVGKEGECLYRGG